MPMHQQRIISLQTFAIFRRIALFEEPKKYHFPNVIEKIQ
jgi:hypothetical protein